MMRHLEERGFSRSRSRSRPRSPSPIPEPDRDSHDDDDDDERRPSKRRRVDPNPSPTAQRITIAGPREDVPGQPPPASGPEPSGSLSAMADVATRDELAYVIRKMHAQAPAPAPVPGATLEEEEEDEERLAPPIEYKSECWWCDRGDADYDGQNDDGCKGYALAIEYINKNFNLPPSIIAANVARICEMHIYRPAYEAARRAIAEARVAPDDAAAQQRAREARRAVRDMHRVTPEEVLRHIQHSLNPQLERVETLREAKSLKCVSQQKLRDSETGESDIRRLEQARRSIETYDRLNKDWEKYAESRGVKFDITLDLSRIAAAADMQGVRPFLVEHADALGGATAAGSSADQANTRVALPAFGAASTLPLTFEQQQVMEELFGESTSGRA